MDERHDFFSLADREIHVTQWGDKANPPIILWHGLSRTGYDFEPLARRLSGDFWLIAPDAVGRGKSQWAKDPTAEYCMAFMGRLASALMDAMGIATAHWIGTSMGGALGIHLAGGPLKGRIGRLVINDIGPEVPAQSIADMLSYVPYPPVFDTMLELEAYFRTLYAPFGPVSDRQWRDMTLTSARRRDDGRLTLHYDPRVADQFKLPHNDYAQWPTYDAITAPTLLVRGGQSDLLTQEIAQQMTERGPAAILRTDPRCGHAPALNNDLQLGWLEDFLA